MLVLALAIPLFLTSCDPAPTGTILYSGSNGSNGWDLYTIKGDGSGRVRLTADPAFIEQWPSWSPDGSRIAFRGGNPADPSTWELYTMAAAGGAKTRLTTNNAADSVPRWSPDGSKIIFSSNRNDPNKDCTFDPCDWNLFALTLSSGVVTRLTSTTDGEYGATYKPDGAKIAFSRFEGGTSAVYTMNANGTNVVRLTPLSHNGQAADWSPDGSKVAYSDKGCDTCSESDLWIINADGTGARRVTNTPSVQEIGAAWSPNGTFLVFDREVFSPQSIDVYRIKADGTGLTNLTSPGGTLEIEPDWKA